MIFSKLNNRPSLRLSPILYLGSQEYPTASIHVSLIVFCQEVIDNIAAFQDYASEYQIKKFIKNFGKKFLTQIGQEGEFMISDQCRIKLGKNSKRTQVYRKKV